MMSKVVNELMGQTTRSVEAADNKEIEMTSTWQSIEQADKKFQWWARDNYGSESWTWHDGDAWVRKCWREHEDQEEYMCDEWWEPVEYLPETKRN